MIAETLKEISNVLRAWEGPIIVAYSGGKDLSAVLKLLVNAILLQPRIAPRVTIIYCDTKVENPILDGFVKRTLKALKAELKTLGLNIGIKIFLRLFIRDISSE